MRLKVTKRLLLFVLDYFVIVAKQLNIQVPT